VIFTELRFFPFLLVVLGVHWLLPWARARKLWLLLASWAFYATWDWRFLSLLLFSTVLDYTVGLRLVRPGARKKAWVTVSLVGNLGLLGFFKYYDFFVRSAADFLALLGLQAHLPTLNIILPVGISFYTFQTLSYALDVYRGQIEPRRNLLDFAMFVAFFPQLVAGPIVRATVFLPQLDRPRRWADVDVRAALVLFLVGFLKKACIADGVAPAVDRYFAAPESFGVLSAWIGVLCYATQIYCDFSGYSDMAIACAALFGYRLVLQLQPAVPGERPHRFWRRWHMSLSSWLRDYLYVPLGGNRGGRLRTYRNLMLTMLLGGLWHGAAWNFVLWGGLHGVGLAFLRALRENGVSLRIPRWLGVALTFWFVCVAWIFFRAQNMADAGVVLRAFVLLRSTGQAALDRRILWVLAALAVVHALPRTPALTSWWRRGPGWLFAGGYALAVAVVVPFIAVNFVPFIYFQF
jgi:alginate O-acetyltransferase complex protein AlgI